MLEVTKDTFEAEVLGSDVPVLVDFWAPWCGPCRVTTPTLEKLSTTMTNVKFVKVNVDQEPDLAQRFEIMSIPSFLLFKNGERVADRVGAADEATFQEFIEKHI